MPTHVVAYLPGAFPPHLAGRLHPTLSASPRRPRPPAGPGWLHEVKHDGYRIVARKEGERVSLWTRYGADFTDRLLTIAEAVPAWASATINPRAGGRSPTSPEEEFERGLRGPDKPTTERLSFDAGALPAHSAKFVAPRKRANRGRGH
jgi:hypothetical protein